MKLEIVDPALDPRWQAMADRTEAGLFHSPPWMRALTRTYGFPIEAAIVEGPEAAQGIAYCHLDGLPGPRVVSLPFSDACDPLVRSRSSWDRLFAELSSRGVPVRCLDDQISAADERFATVRRGRWHHVAVLGSDEEQARTVDAAARRAVRRAIHSSVEVRRLEAPEVEEFHRLHVGLRKRKYRLLAQPAAWFRSLSREFGEAGGWHPLGAFHRGRLIAATIYLRWGRKLYYKFNASDLEFLRMRANSLLLWEGSRLARSLGCAELDLGLSDDDQPGLIRFKRQFGAVEREVRHLRWTPPGWRDPRADQVQALIGRLTVLLTDPETPDELAAKAGEILYPVFA
jgi:CelD/BcsL family acetyltransferase involved in cellulose biosynthesis